MRSPRWGHPRYSARARGCRPDQREARWCATTAADLDRLRAAGLSEVDIFQVVLAVAARRFLAGVLDAVGAEPDPHLLETTA